MGNIIKNPLCDAFPRIARCDFWMFGSGGKSDKPAVSAICILALNVINDKVS